MGAYKDKGGRWYVSVRYRNWLGEPARKTKRGFTTKRDALAWEREFLQKSAGSLDMTFNSFYEVYRNDRRIASGKTPGSQRVASSKRRSCRISETSMCVM